MDRRGEARGELLLQVAAEKHLLGAGLEQHADKGQRQEAQPKGKLDVRQWRDRGRRDQGGDGEDGGADQQGDGEMPDHRADRTEKRQDGPTMQDAHRQHRAEGHAREGRKKQERARRPRARRHFPEPALRAVQPAPERHDPEDRRDRHGVDDECQDKAEQHAPDLRSRPRGRHEWHMG